MVFFSMRDGGRESQERSEVKRRQPCLHVQTGSAKFQSINEIDYALLFVAATTHQTHHIAIIATAHIPAPENTWFTTAATYAPRPNHRALVASSALAPGPPWLLLASVLVSAIWLPCFRKPLALTLSSCPTLLGLFMTSRSASTQISRHAKGRRGLGDPELIWIATSLVWLKASRG